MEKSFGDALVYGAISEVHSSPEGHGYAALSTITHIERSVVNKEAEEANKVAIESAVKKSSTTSSAPSGEPDPRSQLRAETLVSIRSPWLPQWIRQLQQALPDVWLCQCEGNPVPRNNALTTLAAALM